ncbi:MAG: response regulator [Rhodobacteraceae bacterium]|nr:response regulator [Paracoccaceae bacterium]
MAENEQLREALLELRSLRESEARNLLETNALLGSLEKMTMATSRRGAISALLSDVANALNCELVGVLQPHDSGMVFSQANIAKIEGLEWLSNLEWPRKKRRVIELRMVPLIAEALPALLVPYHGLLSIPFEISGGATAILVCFSVNPDHFTGQDEHLLLRFGALAAQAVLALELENQRDEAQTRLKAALASTDQGFLAIDHDGLIVFGNDAFRDFFACENECWKVGNCFVHAWQAYLVSQGVPEQQAGVQAEKYYLSLLEKANNTEITLADGRTIQVNERPTIDGGAVVVANNITQQKNAEHQAHQSAAAVENARDGIAIADKDGLVIYINPSLIALWQCASSADIIGQHWSHFYTETDARFFQRSGQSQLMREGFWRGEMHIGEGKTDATVHDVTLTYKQEAGIVLIARDISARLRNEHERVRMQKLLDRAERRVSLFQVVAGLAHDFNNLLSTITGSASLIVSDETAITAHADAKRISIAGQHAAELVNKFLEVSAPAHVNKSVDLRVLLQETVDLASSSMRAGSTLVADFGIDAAFANTNQTDVLQVVLNLIVNAQDALGNSGGEIKVSLQHDYKPPKGPHFQHGGFHPDRTYVTIVVEDTGSGIPADQLESIFKPYMTTKGKSGTGLGLSIVNSIVSVNKGVVCVYSTEQLGTAFAVHWPVEVDTPVAKPEVEIGVSMKDIPILMVDDQIGVSRVYARILERQGAEVSTCSDPNIALEAISEDPDAWGCLITDYDMPVMNGGELIEKVRKVAPDIPIILVTAHSKSLNDPRITRDTVDRILAKPVDAKTLSQAVSVALAKRKGRKK